MGLTPLEGLVMGTRSGDFDPAIVFYLMNKAGLAPGEIEKALNKRAAYLEYPVNTLTDGIYRKLPRKAMKDHSLQ